MGDLVTAQSTDMVVGVSTAGTDVSNSRLMSLAQSSLLMLRWWTFLRICPDGIDTKYDLIVFLQVI